MLGIKKKKKNIKGEVKLFLGGWSHMIGFPLGPPLRSSVGWFYCPPGAGFSSTHVLTSGGR